MFFRIKSKINKKVFWILPKTLTLFLVSVLSFIATLIVLAVASVTRELIDNDSLFISAFVIVWIPCNIILIKLLWPKQPCKRIANMMKKRLEIYKLAGAPEASEKMKKMHFAISFLENHSKTHENKKNKACKLPVDFLQETEWLVEDLNNEIFGIYVINGYILK